MSTPDAAQERELKAIIGSRKAVASGYLRLLSLEALRARMGDKWAARADHIRFVSEAAIKRHLQRGQTFYQADASSYVIVFDFDDADRAEAICRAISREIIQRLLGSSESQDEALSIELRVAVVTGSQIPNGAALPAALEKALGAAAPKVVSGIEDGGDRSEAEAVRQPRSSDGFLRDLLQQAGRALADGDPRAEAAGLAGVPGFAVRYLPFWNVGARAFLAYRVDPRLHDAALGPVGAGSLRADALGDDIADPDLIRDFDRLVLELAIRDLNRAIAAGAKYVAAVPLHAASLARDSDQRALLKFLELQPAPVLQLLTLEIVNTRKSRFNDLVRHVWMLRDRCRQVILRQDMANVPWLQSQHLPDGAVGMSVKIPDASVAEPEIVAAMNDFVKAVAKYRIETYVYGLRSRSLAFAAIGAGFSQVSGTAIAARSRTPNGVASATMAELFPAATPL